MGGIMSMFGGAPDMPEQPQYTPPPPAPLAPPAPPPPTINTKIVEPTPVETTSIKKRRAAKRMNMASDVRPTVDDSSTLLG